MREFTLVAALLATISPASALISYDGSFEALDADGKELVEMFIKNYEFKDPSSVQVSVYKKKIGLYCGIYNAKNSYGAYVGFYNFAVMIDDLKKWNNGSGTFSWYTKLRAGKFCK